MYCITLCYDDLYFLNFIHTDLVSFEIKYTEKKKKKVCIYFEIGLQKD